MKAPFFLFSAKQTHLILKAFGNCEIYSDSRIMPRRRGKAVRSGWEVSKLLILWRKEWVVDFVKGCD